MIFRQLFDAPTSSFTYLLADPETRQGVLIDSVFEQHLRDAALVRELKIDLRFTLETHIHADHVTGAWLMKQAVGSEIAIARATGAEGADRLFDSGNVIELGTLALEVRATPGHTCGCASFVASSRRAVFTGDALLIRGAGRTDFQQGDAHRLFHSVREQLFTLPGDFAVFPGHDYQGRCSSTIAEERAYNPRLGDTVREQDFVGYMNHLGLPHPKRLAEAVPANLRCGRPDVAPKTPDWGPVVRTFAGVWQVEPEWVVQHRAEVRILDVRETDEIAAGPIGNLADARVIPLSTLRQRLGDVPRDRPIVAVCPTGARSAMAATILEQSGVERIANLRGGLFEWVALGLPLE
jgi:glyoxylase-like metal-dependent hydrolase (beta-lactamase superfamily II)/rhodanese-related sulfurtransferase